VTQSSLVTRGEEPAPLITDEMVKLLENYYAVVKGELEGHDQALAEIVMKQADNTWNNADVSPSKAESNRQFLRLGIQDGLDIAKTQYAKCTSFRTDFSMAFERISDHGRSLRCVSSWMATETGRHLRYSYPRILKPVELAHFVRTSIESALIA
jgi:hypothetical protein